MRSRDPTLAEIAAWEGVSTYATEEQARKRALENAARGFPIGGFIAKLVIPEEAPIAIALTNEKTGYCNLTGEPKALLASVVLVVKV